MATTLTETDCIYILNYYNVPIPNNAVSLQQLTENVISINLCKCIQNKTNKNRSKNKLKHKNIKIYV